MRWLTPTQEEAMVAYMTHGPPPTGFWARVVWAWRCARTARAARRATRRAARQARKQEVP